MARILPQRYPNSMFYTHVSLDVRVLELRGVPVERVGGYENFWDWVDDLNGMDWAFGGRIHGNMVAMAACIPMFLVSIDQRLLELVQETKIHHVASVDPNFEKLEDNDVAKMIGDANFNGTAFDLNHSRL